MSSGSPVVWKGVLVRATCALVAAAVSLWGAIYFLQERLIFPGLSLPKSHGSYSLLPGVSAVSIQTSDGETLRGFTSIPGSASTPNPTSDFVALIFHGNGESAETQNFIPFFKNVGIPALTFDYRGYGDSTGYPSEQGLYRDAEAAAAKVQELSGLPYSRFVILGNSIGAGPAAYLARKIQPHAVVLLAGFADFSDLVGEQPFYGWFRSALRYRFPVTRYLQGLAGQCVVLAHGKQDELIPFANMARIAAALPAGVRLTQLVGEQAGHNDIFYKVEQQLVAATKGCLAG